MGRLNYKLLPWLGWALAGLGLNGVDALTPLRDLCPVTCLEAGPNPSNWSVVADISQLQACQKPMVLDFSVRIPLQRKQHIRVCNVFTNDFDNPAGSDTTSVFATADVETKQVFPQLAWTPAASEDEIGGRLVGQSIGHLKSYLANNHQASKPASRIMLFGTVSDTTTGVYVGANLLGSSIAGNLFDSFLNNVYGNGIADSKASLVQLCEGRSGDDIFGLIAVSSAKFSTVHDAVSSWSNGTCVDTTSYAKTRELGATAIAVIKPVVAPTPSNNTAAILGRADACRIIRVDDQDDCGKLVTRCGGGLTAANFYKYNPSSTLCSKLMPGQPVCCTAGELPDIKPKQNADGSCVAYQIKKDDNCSKVAVANGLVVTDLEGFNNDTWGWNGCDSGFWTDNWICLSKGTPPFPAPIPNGVCGPQKPGTTKPSGSTSKDWLKLNPCPLNACCNVWAQCGTTADFCIDTSTGPPGTAKKDTYGCISNCGMSIIQSGPPAQFRKLGYFEGFNLGRDCLNMDASQIDPSFTHVHFAFGMITPQFEIYQENQYAEFQFQQFKKIRGPKRIISFGGWVFSAEAPNYPILRDSVSDATKREKFATNLVKYVVDNGLDGLDIDWEYPAAPDLPDIEPGDLAEATGYLRLLALIRSKLPKDKSLSIAAPASYWYLKQFPMKAISELLDYIVYMTYDLHGQWDAGNQWSSPGCPSGNCLRSHINRTETLNSLSMITKAGVPSNKILVGVTSYGRSFQMADPSCTGPNCLFTGDRTTSYARKGRCTKTGGYLANAELNEIGGRTWMDVESDSKIMVDGDLWVSYMDNDLKNKRTQLYQRYNLGGTSDWAVDLVSFVEPPSSLGGLGWPRLKTDIRAGMFFEQISCNSAEIARTGTWVAKSCDVDEIGSWTHYTPKQRWDALDCPHAWDDAIKVWQSCHEGQGDGIRFTKAISEFIHGIQNSNCDDLSIETNCPAMFCKEHNAPEVPEKEKTGACTYEIWNSISELSRMIKNYYYSLSKAGDDLGSTKEEFISIFAPKSDSGIEFLMLLLTLIPIPLNAGAARFFGGGLAGKLLGGSPSAAQKSVWEAATSNIVSAGSSIAKDALAKAKDGRSEIAFNAIFDTLITSWISQTDLLIRSIFNGDKDSIRRLSEIFSNGNLIDGKLDNGITDSTNGHTDSWNREKSIQRAFYAAAIPAAWAANRPAPIVIDFGPSCEIDARNYFNEPPNIYNTGWRCIDGHSYILAGVRDGPQEACGQQTPGNTNQCPPVKKWTFNMLKGMEVIRTDDNKWGGVTVDELIKGAINTYNMNDKKNIMDASRNVPDATNKTITEEYASDKLNIKRAGLIRIPICSPEEATANLNKGRKYYGDSLNYPCNA
ncbi:hypothetical protein V499_07337 [Pseudogymnoascus sp. VKM F-103]|nr:hypothetical protein V499_07337 [Pseudogymnoascus sp. VKM F-103]